MKHVELPVRMVFCGVKVNFHPNDYINHYPSDPLGEIIAELLTEGVTVLLEVFLSGCGVTDIAAIVLSEFICRERTTETR